MERTRERLVAARQALTSLQALPLDEEVSDVVRDAAIQRFEYTFEALWKSAQAFLRAFEGLDRGSPKGVIRACLQTNLLNDAQTNHALAMTDDRNLTSHTYNESLAKQIFSRLPEHARLMDAWLTAMEERC